MTATARKRARTAQRGRARANRPNPLKTAHTALLDAVSALCHPRPNQDSRYGELRDAINSAGSSAGHRTDSRRTPCWIDALKLAMLIDTRTATATGVALHVTARGTTPDLLHALTLLKWRPQDAEHVTTIATEIASWAKAIDDLFAPKPIYLRGHACPHCGQTHARVKTDDGDTVSRPALAVTAEGAWCQACHDPFHPPFLGEMLGYRVEGISA